MMLVAAVEHAARTFPAALTERCCGPAGYEDSDHFDAERWLIPPVDPATLRTARVTWIPELCHSRNPDDPPTVRTTCDELAGHAGDHRHGQVEFWSQSPSSTTPPAGQPPVDDDSWPADSDIPPSPAGQPPTVPAEVSTRTPTPAPSAGLTWIQWAIPGIQDVLAAHVCFYNEHCANFGCWEDGDLVPHASFDDPQEWREHVAPAVAERLDMAWRARQSRQFIETGHDMGVSIACETFPQYRGGLL